MSELKQTSVALLERAIDDKIAKAVRGGQSTHLATVTRVGNDGTTWVQVYGGAEETPVRRMTTAAQVGDVINVTFSGLSCMGVGNVSSPSATTVQVQKVASESANAIAGVMAGILQIRQLIADKVSTRELTAEVARIMNAQIDTITANIIQSQEMQAAFLSADLANMVAADVDMERVKELVAESGLFQDLTVTGDGTITGKLGAVLVDGDTARFSNIYADALKLLGEDGLYHALNFMGLDERKIYTYSQVAPAGTENPSEEGWYVLVDGSYVPATDTTVVSGTAYYSQSWSYADPETQVVYDEYGESLDEGLHGSHLIAESVTATQIDVSTLIAAMLLTQFVQVGASATTHMEARGNRLSFFAGGNGWKTMRDSDLYEAVDTPTGSPLANGWYELVDPDAPLLEGRYMPSTDTTVDVDKTYYRYLESANRAFAGEVAYIAVDPDTGESMFYMTRSVVVKELHIGQWSYFRRRNGNLALKWIGGEV